VARLALSLVAVPIGHIPIAIRHKTQGKKPYEKCNPKNFGRKRQFVDNFARRTHNFDHNSISFADELGF
jgi:hypothetical protein